MIDPRTLGSGEHDDVARFREMTPEQRLTLFLELCDLTDGIVRGRPDAERLRAPTPRSADAEALWQRLMRARVDRRR